MSAPDRILDRLERDICGRPGLKFAWAAIEDDILDGEIRPAWEKIIREEIAAENANHLKVAEALACRWIAVCDALGVPRNTSTLDVLNHIMAGRN